MDKGFLSENIQEMVSRNCSKGRLKRLFPMIDKLVHTHRLSYDDIVALSRKEGKNFIQ